MLGGIRDFISSILDKIKELITAIGNILNYLNPFSEHFILKDVITFLGNILSYINPFSDNFFLKEFFTWFGNFFTALYDFFIHIFVPTDDQWNTIKNNYVSIGDNVKNHLPFVSLFSDELKKAQETVDKNDFLVITIPSFSFSSGGVGVTTESQQIINVRNKYEPFRLYIRGGLFLIVVGMAFVFIIKHILNAHHSQINGNVEKGGN